MIDDDEKKLLGLGLGLGFLKNTLE